MGIALRTLQRWRRQFAGDGDGVDRRKGSYRMVSHRLTEEERTQILRTCNQPHYAALPPGQIVPDLADQGAYLASESSFYRVLHAHGQDHRRGRARPPQAPREVPRLKAEGPNQVWSWHITYLPTSERGGWLYLYMVINVWSRKVVAWDVADREDSQIAADLVGRACLRERIMLPCGYPPATGVRLNTCAAASAFVQHLLSRQLATEGLEGSIGHLQIVRVCHFHPSQIVLHWIAGL